ncbi:hypothetical protein TBR22_A23460 [Luteitalea sp. TBR-22]|uniref:response regulator transcription factor n=1 Tax=Luteitalea sp. TBR-22 TaxID=2802971 RepID=UPI001EF591E9|nr:response regulator [Luteitalea sp. TBR-22]BCS33119.2 hypothetical protein TBR22_A23460 [Luteitalea sp. TBR-22]
MTGSPVVIVVDDDDSLRDAMRRLLEAAGFTPMAYPCGEALIAEGVTPEAACVVTDLKLPGMTGLDLLARLKTLRPGLPVVLITAHDDPATREHALQHGASAYIAKPFRGTALLQVITSVLVRA